MDLPSRMCIPDFYMRFRMSLCLFSRTIGGSIPPSGITLPPLPSRFFSYLSLLISYFITRVIEGVFEELLSWATNAIETSSNQPVLPHAIIVLNASDHDNRPDFWNSKSNTAEILKSVSRVLNTNERLRFWVDSWRERGKNIATLGELILCYYSSIEV